MSNLRAAAPEHETAKGSWGEIFDDGRGLYSALVIGGIAMQATQMLVIAIIMPTTCSAIQSSAASALSPTRTILTFEVPGGRIGRAIGDNKNINGRATSE